MPQRPLSKKRQVITELYRQCKERGDLRFNNNAVKAVCAKIGFGNPYDATKWDSSSLLPPMLVEDDTFVVHLGKGWHQFVHGISIGYHRFEDVPETDTLQWNYARSVLNNVNSSESNILSVGYNQRIIHDFLYKDITASPRVYGSNRTHIPLNYSIGDRRISVKRVQVEIDYTVERQGAVTIFEAKNGFPEDFNVFQLFNPVRYYTRLKETRKLPIDSVESCYLLRDGARLRLYLYTFDDLDTPASIRLLRNAEYTLVER